MRRLALIVTCIAILGAGAAVWISGAGASVVHRPALRLFPALRSQRAPTLRALPAAPAACYVGAGSCPEHPCVEFVSPSSAVYQPALPAVTLASPVRSRCRASAARVQRVGAAIVTAQSGPVSVHRTSGVQLVR